MLSQSFNVILLDKGGLALEGSHELVVDGLRLTRGLHSALGVFIGLFSMADRVVLEEGVVFFVSKSSGIARRLFETGLALICDLVLAFS